MNILETKVTYCPERDKSEIVEYKTLQEVLLEIRDGKVAKTIQQLRQIPNDEGHKQQRRKKKGELPVVLWQGIFNKRSNDGLQQLTGIICIDIDHSTPEKLLEIKTGLINSPYVVAFFDGPSGDGLKILFLTDIDNPTLYKNCYKHLEKQFEATYGIKPDSNCEALSQGCYLSWDPCLYVNPNAQAYHYGFDSSVEEDKPRSPVSTGSTWVPPQITRAQKFMNKLAQQVSPVSDEYIIGILDRRFQRFPDNYKDGHRTKSIFAQGATLCKAGIPEDKALDYLMERFLPTGYEPGRLKRETHRAYEVNTDYFGSERGKYKSYSNYKKKY